MASSGSHRPGLPPTSDLGTTAQRVNQAFERRLVWTPPIERLVEEITDWISLDVPGVFVHGKQRIGKTLAMSYLSGRLSAALDLPVSIVAWSIPSPAPRTELRFWQEILVQFDKTPITGNSPALLLGRLIKGLSHQVQEAGAKKLVLVLDEGQNLEIRHFQWLTHMNNVLTKQGIDTFYISVGQPELSKVPDTFLQMGQMQVIGRFFKKGHEFKGIAPNEIPAVLSAFDQPAVGADNSALPISQMIFPDAFDQGWRLDRISQPFEDALEKLTAHYKIEHAIRIPMQDLRAVVKGIVQTCADDPSRADKMQAADILKCMVRVGFAAIATQYVDSRLPRIHAKDRSAQ